MNSALLLHLRVASSRCLRVTFNNGGGIVSTKFLGRSSRPAISIVASRSKSSHAFPRAANDIVISPSSASPPDISPSHSNTFAQWDGLANGKTPNLTFSLNFLRILWSSFLEDMNSALLLHRTVASSRCLRVAYNNGGGIVSTKFLVRSSRPAISIAASRSKSSHAFPRAANDIVISPSSASPTDISPSHSNKLVQWDGLANGKTPNLTHARSFPIIGSAIPLLSGIPKINPLTNAYNFWIAMRNQYGEFYTFGSIAIPQLSGIPKINPLTNAYDFWIAMRNQYGEFYTFGSMIAGNPNDIYRTSYIINDPREFVKIIRAGGKFPSGVLENLWVNVRWAEMRGFHTREGIHGRGEEWRRIRTFLQTDLLHPDSARGYLQMAGNPNDIYRTSYIINDPREFVKIIRAGGKFPSGVLENLWVNVRWAEMQGFHTREGIHGRGEEWRRIRTFLQTDMLHPDSARGYLPGIIHSAGLASKGAQAAAMLQSSGEENGALNSYLDRCAFDMFSSMMLGIYTETADETTRTDPENERFVKGAVQGLGTAIEMIFSRYELIIGKLLKFETPMMKHCFEGFDAAWAIARDKIESFIERKERGELSENEQVSYLSRALDRQKEEGSNVTVREVMELAFISMFAAVDTTASVLSWNLLHIARSPDVQEKLFQEISASVETVGHGKITAEVLSKSNAPYLHALIRETHRLTPAGAIGLMKTVDVDNLEVHGRKMEKGDVVLLESYSQGMNSDLVENPEEFRPERWLRDAVEARKGSPSEIIDHPFLASPFSQGARKCPGSRVATNEIKVLLSQLVLDWKISSPITELENVRYHQRSVIEVKLP
eukprot:CAMPEP_0202028336 /NCGR_PEP_ID=MMETSP0905-20130828/63394_1 /ASSEMBLY_ACC=CAM_ASM_000554 /TAXON_ID=420261 /ORGANISM="Thalassiosira antarctica, Strain CCMP982" /LENGTH=830 /DNA_ID=CAMNT_0048592037 /DNA_START=106 /DNA_END=2595 /DNA_ORIENTATION=-